MKLIYIIPLYILLASSSIMNAAEDGKILYAQMCAACHGKDGQGIGNGTFPPLKDSEWLTGDGERIAQIMLHGLTGPIKVKRIDYNLAMPAQGSLSDEGKVAVIRYIKKEFSGEETQFSLADLQKTKSTHKNRIKPWTSKELLKLYPLPAEQPPINNLVMYVYHGKWSKMPDFTKLEPIAVEEEHSGYISFKNVQRKELLGIVWTGDIIATENSNYQFELMAKDGAIIFINDKEVCQLKGLGAFSKNRSTSGKITLKKGSHKIKVHYFNHNNPKNISIKWKNTEGETINTKKLTESSTVALPTINITPTDGKTRMYHNFIKGSTHRTMGVGFPHGFNMAFSTEDCQPDLIWKGQFINAGRHWTNRGQGAQDPLSDTVIELGQGVAWSQDNKKLKLKLLGYTMDKSGNPTFNYKATGKDITFSEKFILNDNTLSRSITIISDAERSLELRLAKGKINLSKLNATVDQKLTIHTPNIKSKGNVLLSSLNLKKGTNTHQINYSWAE